MVETTPGDGERYVNTVEAARLIGVSSSAVRYWLITGRLPAEQADSRSGKKWAWKIKVSDLLETDRKAKESSRSARPKREESSIEG